MIRRLLPVLALLAAVSLAGPRVGHAQMFKVEKFDIKGEGGTDYVAVEVATGRVFVSCAAATDRHVRTETGAGIGRHEADRSRQPTLAARAVRLQA